MSGSSRIRSIASPGSPHLNETRATLAGLPSVVTRSLRDVVSASWPRVQASKSTAARRLATRHAATAGQGAHRSLTLLLASPVIASAIFVRRKR